MAFRAQPFDPSRFLGLALQLRQQRENQQLAQQELQQRQQKLQGELRDQLVNVRANPKEIEALLPPGPERERALALSSLGIKKDRQDKEREEAVKAAAAQMFVGRTGQSTPDVAQAGLSQVLQAAQAGGLNPQAVQRRADLQARGALGEQAELDLAQRRTDVLSERSAQRQTRELKKRRIFEIENPTPTDFRKAVKEWKSSDDPIERELLGLGLAKKLSTTTRVLKADGDGGFTMIEGPGAGKALTAASRDKLDAQAFSAKRGAALSKAMLGAIAEDPGRVGISGNIKRKFQVVGTSLQDLDREFGLNLVRSAAEGFALLRADENATEGVRNLALGFDPAQATLNELENSLAYLLARMRRGNSRMAIEDVNNARKSVNTRRWTSAAFVTKGLQAVNAEFNSYAENIDSRLKLEPQADQGPERIQNLLGLGQRPAPTPTPAAPPAEKFKFNRGPGGQLILERVP